jgi:hypothetical protein
MSEKISIERVSPKEATKTKISQIKKELVESKVIQSPKLINC